MHAFGIHPFPHMAHVASFTNNTTFGQKEDTSPVKKRSAAKLNAAMFFSLL